MLHAMLERSASGDEEGGDIVAWSFDPACILQSDIVGFTALSSKIDPEVRTPTAPHDPALPFSRLLCGGS